MGCPPFPERPRWHSPCLRKNAQRERGSARHHASEKRKRGGTYFHKGIHAPSLSQSGATAPASRERGKSRPRAFPLPSDGGGVTWRRPTMRRYARRATHAPVLRRAFAALSILLVWVLASSAAHAGTRYFYCHAMDEMRAGRCCSPSVGAADAHPPQGSPQVTIVDAECCSARTLPVGPRATRPDAPLPPAAPLVAVVPPLDLGVRIHAPAASVRGLRAPSPVPLRSASERRSRLMVFLS